MKSAYCLLIIGLLVCCREPDPTNQQIAEAAMDYFVKKYQVGVQPDQMHKGVEDDLMDSLLLRVTIDRKISADLNVERLYRSILINGHAVVKYGDGYLVDCTNYDEDSGNHPNNSYCLVQRVNEQWLGIRELRREDFPAMTIKKIRSDKSIIAQTLDGDYALPADTTYHEMIVRGDSLLRVRQVTAADTL